GEASNAVRECFIKWREDFGQGDIEDKQCLQAIRDFIDKHGNSRFSSVNGIDDSVVRDRAGYTKSEAGEKITYLFNNAGMEESTKENSLKRTLQALHKHGWLRKDGRHWTKKQRINGGTSRFYFITLPDEV
ncbi:[similarity to] inner membrane protein, partial [methanotrophic bacterial endosymbiont of Bathymodiolus sp.]